MSQSHPIEAGFEITLATASDVPAMLAISNDAAARTAANFATEPETLESWTRSFATTHDHYPWLVARSSAPGEPEVIGFAKASPHRARGAYAWTAEVAVYLAPHRHRRGVGTALYERLIPTLRAQGYVLLIAGIALPNPASERLHDKFGFRRCGTFHRVGWKLGAWRDVGYWELDLAPVAPDVEAAPAPIRPVREVWRSGPVSSPA